MRDPVRLLWTQISLSCKLNNTMIYQCYSLESTLVGRYIAANLHLNALLFISDTYED